MYTRIAFASQTVYFFPKFAKMKNTDAQIFGEFL